MREKQPREKRAKSGPRQLNPTSKCQRLLA